MKPKTRAERVKSFLYAVLVEHYFIGSISIFISLSAIYLAAKFNATKLGGAGGAIGIVVTFCLFLFDQGKIQKTFLHAYQNIPKTVKVLDSNGKETSNDKPRPEGEVHADQIQAIVSRLNITDSGQTRQNWALAVASIVGTLAWAFGESLSNWLRDHHIFGT